MLSACSAYEAEKAFGLRRSEDGPLPATLSLLQLRSTSPVSSAKAHDDESVGGSTSEVHRHGASAHPGPALRLAELDRAALLEYAALLGFIVGAICAMKRVLGPDDVKTPNLHLITARGFLLQVFMSMMIFFAAAALASRLPALQNDCPFHVAVEMLVAQKKGVIVSVWSVFGLFSSSCCAIQLVLNVFNIGCAGFNTVLGPWRPIFIGLTATLQTAVWAHVYLNPHMWYMAAVGSLVACSLSFLPEFLHLFSVSRATLAARDASLTLHVDGMGCAACTSAVHAICAADDRVLGCAISFEERLVRCAVAGKSGNLADELCLRLTDAGFDARAAIDVEN